MDCVERYRISQIKSAQFGTRSARKNESTKNDNVEAAEVTDDSDKDETMHVVLLYKSQVLFIFCKIDNDEATTTQLSEATPCLGVKNEEGFLGECKENSSCSEFSSESLHCLFPSEICCRKEVTVRGIIESRPGELNDISARQYEDLNKKGCVQIISNRLSTV